MVIMHRKFNDDIFARALVIMKNVLIDALAQILTEIYKFQNLTRFVTW